MGSHIIDGKFQSDKYPETPRGFIALKISDPNAQPGLDDFARRHRDTDPGLSDDLEWCLEHEGYHPDAPSLEVLYHLDRRKEDLDHTSEVIAMLERTNEQLDEARDVLKCAITDDGHVHRCSRDPCSPWCETVRAVLGIAGALPESPNA